MARVDLAGEFVITRVFRAPRDLVFKGWTEPARLAEWWGPAGMTMKVHSLDLRVGGMFLYSIGLPDGEVFGKFVYEEIVAPERMVYASGFCDAEGTPVRHPLAPTWPLEMHNALTLVEHEGKTTLTLRIAAMNANAEECATFLAGHKSMQAGYGGTLDKLHAYLANA